MLERSRRIRISLAHITFGTQHLGVELLKYPTYQHEVPVKDFDKYHRFMNGGFLATFFYTLSTSSKQKKETEPKKKTETHSTSGSNPIQPQKIFLNQHLLHGKDYI